MAVTKVSVCLVVVFIAYRWYLKPKSGVVSLDTVKQLIQNKYHAIYKISNLEYVSSGAEFDCFMMNLNRFNQSYLIRIFRHQHNIKKLNKFKYEMTILLPTLNKHLSANNIMIQIPNYNVLLSNITDPHSSFIYGSYPFIAGKQLVHFDANTRCQILLKNANKLSNLFGALFSFNIDKTCIKHKSSFDLFLWQINSVEFYYKKLPKQSSNNQTNIDFIDFAEIISECRNILLPKWKQNEHRFLTGLVHWDFNLKHILCDEDDNIVGVIDWSDVRIVDIAFQFGCIRRESKAASDQIIDLYLKNIGLNDEKQKKLFLFVVDVYGMMFILVVICWSKLESVENQPKIMYYIDRFKNELKIWKKNLNIMHDILE